MPKFLWLSQWCRFQFHWQWHDKPSMVVSAVVTRKCFTNICTSRDITGCLRLWSSISQNIFKMSSSCKLPSVVVEKWHKLDEFHWWCLLWMSPARTNPNCVLKTDSEPEGPDFQPCSTTQLKALALRNMSMMFPLMMQGNWMQGWFRSLWLQVTIIVMMLHWC